MSRIKRESVAAAIFFFFTLLSLRSLDSHSKVSQTHAHREIQTRDTNKRVTQTQSVSFWPWPRSAFSKWHLRCVWREVDGCLRLLKGQEEEEEDRVEERGRG